MVCPDDHGLWPVPLFQDPAGICVDLDPLCLQFFDQPFFPHHKGLTISPFLKPACRRITAREDMIQVDLNPQRADPVPIPGPPLGGVICQEHFREGPFL